VLLMGNLPFEIEVACYHSAREWRADRFEAGTITAASGDCLAPAGNLPRAAKMVETLCAVGVLSVVRGTVLNNCPVWSG
jgi:hypothetical protein